MVLYHDVFASTVIISRMGSGPEYDWALYSCRVLWVPHCVCLRWCVSCSYFASTLFWVNVALLSPLVHSGLSILTHVFVFPRSFEYFGRWTKWCRWGILHYAFFLVVLRFWQEEERLNARIGQPVNRLMAVVERFFQLFCCDGASAWGSQHPKAEKNRPPKTNIQNKCMGFLGLSVFFWLVFCHRCRCRCRRGALLSVAIGARWWISLDFLVVRCFLYIVLYDMFQDFDIFQRKTPPKSVEKPKKNTSKNKKIRRNPSTFFFVHFFSLSESQLEKRTRACLKRCILGASFAILFCAWVICSKKITTYVKMLDPSFFEKTFGVNPISNIKVDSPIVVESCGVMVGSAR